MEVSRSSRTTMVHSKTTMVSSKSTVGSRNKVPMMAETDTASLHLDSTVGRSKVFMTAQADTNNVGMQLASPMRTQVYASRMRSSEQLEDWLTESQLSQLSTIFIEFPQDEKSRVSRADIFNALSRCERFCVMPTEGDCPEFLGLGDFVQFLVNRVIFRATLIRASSGRSIRTINPKQLEAVFGNQFVTEEHIIIEPDEFLARLSMSEDEEVIELFRFTLIQVTDRLIVELMHAGKLRQAGTLEAVTSSRLNASMQARIEAGANTEAEVIQSYDPFSPMLRSIIDQAPCRPDPRPGTAQSTRSTTMQHSQSERSLQPPLFYRQFSSSKYKYQKQSATQLYQDFTHEVEGQRLAALDTRCTHNMFTCRVARKRNHVFIETYFDRVPYLEYSGRTPNINIQAGPITLAFEHFAKFLDSSRSAGANPTFAAIRHADKTMSLVETFLFCEHFGIVKENIMTKAEISLLFRVVNTKCSLADEYSNDLSKNEFTEILTRMAIVLFSRPPLAARDHKNWSICRKVQAFIEHFRFDDVAWMKRHLKKAKNESDMIRQERNFLKKGCGISNISVFRISQRVEHLDRPFASARYGRALSTKSRRRNLNPDRSRRASKVRLLDPLRGQNSPRIPPVGMQNNPDRNLKNKWWAKHDRKSTRLMRRALSEPNLEMTISTQKKDKNNLVGVLPGVKNLPDTALCDLYPRHMQPIMSQHWATPDEDWQKYKGPFIDCSKLFYPKFPYKYHLHISNGCSTTVHLRIRCRLPFLRLRYRKNPAGLAPGMSRKIFLAMTLDEVPLGEYFDFIDVDVLDSRRQPMQQIRVPVYALLMKEPEPDKNTTGGKLYIPKRNCLPPICPLKTWNFLEHSASEKSLNAHATRRPVTSMGLRRVQSNVSLRSVRKRPKRPATSMTYRPGTSMSRMTW